VLARAPQLWVWLGDIVYADTPVLLKLRIPATAERLKEHWDAQLRLPEYQALLAAVPVVGVYDDHDQGANDGDRHYNATAHALSQQLFWDFMGEPADSGKRAQSGVYGQWLMGEAPRRIHLLLLDVRTNRDSYGAPDEPEGRQDMLGEEQWAWLEAALRGTTAELTVIGSGIQVVSRGDPWIAEMWYKLPQSQVRARCVCARARVRCEGCSAHSQLASAHPHHPFSQPPPSPTLTSRPA
jgi:alkaline phosphatase D